MHYIRKYVSFVSVESPTESVFKSSLDRRVSFNDQLDDDWSLTALVGADANRETYTGRSTTNENVQKNGR